MSSEAANEEKHTLNMMRPSSAQSDAFSSASTIVPNLNEQSSSMHETPINSVPETSIDAEKQSKTILWISIPSSTDVVPLTLRSCITMSSLFDSVFMICGIAEQQQQNKVLGLRTTLGWTDTTGVRRYMMLKREVKDSFGIFLQIIDESPCWKQ